MQAEDEWWGNEFKAHRHHKRRAEMHVDVRSELSILGFCGGQWGSQHVSNYYVHGRGLQLLDCARRIFRLPALTRICESTSAVVR